jgi:hypothetical protein
MHWFSVLSIQCQLLTLELIPDLGHAPVVVGRNSKQLWVEVDAEFVDRQSEDGVRACSRMLRFPLIFSFFFSPNLRPPRAFETPTTSRQIGVLE